MLLTFCGRLMCHQMEKILLFTGLKLEVWLLMKALRKNWSWLRVIFGRSNPYFNTELWLLNIIDQWEINFLPTSAINFFSHQDQLLSFRSLLNKNRPKSTFPSLKFEMVQSPVLDVMQKFADLEIGEDDSECSGKLLLWVYYCQFVRRLRRTIKCNYHFNLKVKVKLFVSWNTHMHKILTTFFL